MAEPIIANNTHLVSVARAYTTRAKLKPTWLYVIGNEINALVKIGVTANTKKRLAELQCGSPVVLVIRETFHIGDRAQEAEQLLHDRFVYRREHGEWFHVDVAEIVDALAAVLKKIAERHTPGDVHAARAAWTDIDEKGFALERAYGKRRLSSRWMRTAGD